MLKVMLTDYLGNSNKEGMPVGHPVKILKEYKQIIELNFEVYTTAPYTTIDYLKFSNSYKLKYFHNIECVGIQKRLFRMAKDFMNLRHAGKIAKGFDIVWFCNVDYVLFLYLLFHPKLCKKSVITMFRRDFSDDRRMAGLKNKIFKFVSQHLGLILYSDTEFVLGGSANALYMPDYLYFSEKYKEYCELPKQDLCVCLGTMKEDKDLEDVVRIFNNISYKIEIIGKFSDTARFLQLKEHANKNIVIENRYLSEKEYLEKLAAAKYSVLPYKESCYKGRTSGIIVESIFVGTIPIAYEFVLKKNRLNGIALEKLDRDADLVKEMKQEYYNQILGRYSVEKYRDILRERFISLV